MTDREQLLELREDLRRIRDGASIILSDADLELIDRLLARFPYEEKEYILVKHRMDAYWRKAKFVAVCSEGVVAVTEDLQIEMFSQHMPIEKTRTLEVPEEKIELARRASISKIGYSGDDIDAAMKVCQWLAREAGKDG